MPDAHGSDTPPPELSPPAFQTWLWGARLMMVGGVVGSALLALAAMWLGTVDLVRLVSHLADYTSDADSKLRSKLVVEIVKVVDVYLLAAILIVVAFGLYELFIRHLSTRRNDNLGPRVLAAASIDELKDRVAKLISLILVIEMFQSALTITIKDATDLVLLAGSIAIAALAIALPNLLTGSKNKTEH